MKGVSETVKNEVKEQNRGFFYMLAASLGANLLGNMLAGKGVVRGGDGGALAGGRVLRAGQPRLK